MRQKRLQSAKVNPNGPANSSAYIQDTGLRKMPMGVPKKSKRPVSGKTNPNLYVREGTISTA